jgi:hypothetical protein
MEICLFVRLLKLRVMPLFLLMKGVDCLLQHSQPCPFLLDLLSPCLSVQGCGLPCCDDFLLLTKSLNCLLYMGQLLFYSSFVL